MNWKKCRYKNIAEKFSDNDVAKLIEAMILNFDKCGKYYEIDKVVELINDCVSNSTEILNLVHEVAEMENNEIKKGETLPLDCELEFFDEQNITLRENAILNSIFTIIEKDAIKKQKDRYFLRLLEGDKVDFEYCESHNSLKDVIEFYKDGGWGIADKNGTVLVKNHITQKPSTIPPFYNLWDNSYRLIEDCDSGLYGIISFLSCKEVIHCLYQKIEIVSYFFNNKKKYLFKVWRNDKCGCYDENCSLIVECRYDDINAFADLIECDRDGELLYSDSLDQNFERSYEGKKDIYNSYGQLLLGGYNSFDYKEYLCNRRFVFYFGSKYVVYYDKEMDFYDNEIELAKYKEDFNNSICLILDTHFDTLLNSKGESLRLPYGKVFQSVEELENTIHRDFLLHGKIDLTDYDLHSLVYISKRNVDMYVIYDFNPGLPECLLGDDEEDLAHWETHFVEDNEVIIVKIDNGKISWRFKANEICRTCKYLLYRNGERVGFYSQYGVMPAIYSAVTIESNDNNIYVAHITPGMLKSDNKIWNPNYIQHMGYTIQYFELLADGTLVKLQDDWKIFCPKDHKWFPFDFKSKNGFVDEVYDDYYNRDSERSYEKYGGYNGYDDDTIDDAFDGYPEATWNVD